MSRYEKNNSNESTPPRSAPPERTIDMSTICVIVGSVRKSRFSEKPGRWIVDQLRKRGIDTRHVDLRDFPMPFFDGAVPPAMAGRSRFTDEVVQKWTAEIRAADGFVFVTPEYNSGPPAVLENALDWCYTEWNRKAAAFVSYGSVLRARSMRQLHETLIALQIAPLRSSVHIPKSLMTQFHDGNSSPGLNELEASANAMIEDLLWWTEALKSAREKSAGKSGDAGRDELR